MVTEARAAFPADFDDDLEVGPVEGNHAYFGRNVLRGLVEGIDDFIQLRQARWRTFRSVGPVLLGSAMWLNDFELIDKIAELTAACIVIPKQGRRRDELAKMQKLQALNERTPGIPINAFPELTGLAPKVEGKPLVVGPYDRMDDKRVPTIRTIGYRNIGAGAPIIDIKTALPPIVHAKIALLGHFWWHDEDELGFVEDYLGFTPRRLWVSSANFTHASRHHLEFGYWTEDRALMDGAKRFLVTLIRHSEELDPDTDALDPQLAPVDYDDEAMAEALAELSWGAEADE